MLQYVIDEFLHECSKGFQRHTCKIHEIFKIIETKNTHNDSIVSYYYFTQAMLPSLLVTVEWIFVVDYHSFKCNIDTVITIRYQC